GWARAEGDDVAGGLVMMQEGASLFRTVGQRVGLAHRGRLAQGFLASGDIDAALAVVAQALEQRRQTEEGAFVAMHLPLRGAAVLRRDDPAGAQAAFREALEVARGQGAWLPALRAACSLARLDPTALEALDAIVRRFPDTLDASDLMEARALLERAS